MKRMCSFAALLLGFLLFPDILPAQNPGIIEDTYVGPASAFYSGSNITVTRDVLDGIMFFSADNGTTGQEIFSTVPPFDATSTGLLKDMTPGTGGSSQLYHAAYNKLFFVSHENLGREVLCRSDGSLNGTALLYAPTVKRGFYSNVMQIYPSQGMLFFTRSMDKTGNPTYNPTFEFWKTDPVSGASVLLKSNPSGMFDEITPVNGTTVVYAYGSNVLYYTDGTVKRTVAIASLPGGGPSNPYPAQHVYSGCRTRHVVGTNYFITWGDDVYGFELWKTNGTPSGTGRATDINPGAGSSSPSMGTVLNGYLYFCADDGTHGWQVWRIPAAGGTAERITNFGAIDAHPMWLTALNGWLYFSASTQDMGRELWRSNGLPLGDPNAQTALVADINAGASSSNPNYADPARVDRDRKYLHTMAVIGDWLYFAADDGIGYALWRSDGTTTQKLGASQPRLLTPVRYYDNAVAKDVLIFVAWTEATGFELWKFDPQQPVIPKRNDGASAQAFALSANYPNPFRTNTVLEYSIAEAGPVTLTVYDLHGRRVATLVDRWSEAGSFNAVFNADALPAGCYVARLMAQGSTYTRLLTHVK